MIFDSVDPAWLVLAIFLTAFGAPYLSRVLGGSTGLVLAIVPASIFAVFLAGSRGVWSGEIWRGTITWAPQLGMNWDLWISPLGLLLGLLVSGVGTLIALYAGAYLKVSPKRGRFFGFLFLFMGAMLGLAVTEHLLVLFVFWELTSVASYLLIGHYHDKLESRKSALDALLVTGGGGVTFLAGILLLGEVAGTYRIGELYEMQAQILAHPWYPGIFLCVLAGAITKSAQVPFHFWLPGAMAAPAPVSAFLHSATMVKAGVFLLAILHPVLGGHPWWHFSLLLFGAATMTWGALVALVQTDLKRLLAYTTVSALGTLVLLLGIESELAAKAAVVFLVVHAFYKGALFMVAGILEKTTGTRDVKQLRGLMKAMPVLGIAAVMASASMSGIPPFIGFIAKELLYEVKLETPVVGWMLLICGFVANAANIVVALKVGMAPFLRPAGEDPLTATKPSAGLVVGPVILGIGSLILGVFPGPLLGEVISAVVGQIRAEPVTIKLKLWHGFNLVLLLSALTLGAGVAGFLVRQSLWKFGEWLAAKLGWSARDCFRAGLAGVLSFAGWITRMIQSGNLRQYFLVILITGIGLIVWAFRQTGYTLTPPEAEGFRFDAFIVGLLMIFGVIGILRARQRMMTILFLGCVGFGIAALFALYGAPDLAITQLLVETLTLVLFSLAIYGLPQLQAGPGYRGARGKRIIAIAVSVSLGVVFTMLTWKALSLDIHEPVSKEMAVRSLPEAFGRNVVNVILVDFRALDTLGEITVLVIAALGVAAMLSQAETKGALEMRNRSSAVLTASSRYTAPAMVVFSVYLLLRGHNEPGGGFIGGLVGAMASVLVHLAHPSRSLTFLKLTPATLAMLGLVLALISGVPGMMDGRGFLAAVWGPEFSLPAVGKVKLGTPLVFDIGVYLVVAAIVLTLYQRMESWHASRNMEMKTARNG